MFSWEDKLNKAVLNNDTANVKKLLRITRIYGKLCSVFCRNEAERLRRNSLLHLAAYSNSVEVARLLIDRGENVNFANGVGDTPLHTAARYNAWETADLLISSGADIHSVNYADQTPFDIAYNCCNYNVSDLLELAEKQLARKQKY